jgi:hypothetical protein
MNTSYTEVSAVIPTHLVAQFYRFVADAHQGGVEVSQISPQLAMRPDAPYDRIPFPDAGAELIQAWWSKLSDRARDVLAFLAHNADERFTGGELANECETLAGPSGAAGTFNWPSRYATNMGFIGPWDWDGDENAYFMPAINAAALLDAVIPSDG